MKVKVLDIEDSTPEEVQDELNDVLKELADYYIVDIKPLRKDLIAVMYLSEKKSAYRDEDDAED